MVDSLQFALASIPDGDWSQGPRLINAHIKGLITQNAREKSHEEDNYFRQAASVRNTGRLEEARHAYSTAIERFPWNPVGYYGLADTIRSMGLLQDALSVYEMAIERFREEAFPYVGRADVLARMGRLEESLGNMIA